MALDPTNRVMAITMQRCQQENQKGMRCARNTRYMVDGERNCGRHG